VEGSGEKVGRVVKWSTVPFLQKRQIRLTAALVLAKQHWQPRVSHPAACGPRVLFAFSGFPEAVKGNDIQVRNENKLVFEAFGFSRFPSFRDSADTKARSRISALEERGSQQERRLAALEVKLSPLAQLQRSSRACKQTLRA
jgi:hypothetical protein